MQKKDIHVLTNAGTPVLHHSMIRVVAAYWLPLVLYCLAIYIQSGHPAPDSMPAWPHLDKSLHFLVYAGLGILFYRAYGTVRATAKFPWCLVLSVLSAGCYGILDEVHQSFVPFRQADAFDILADAAGAVFGVGLYAVCRRLRAD